MELITSSKNEKVGWLKSLRKSATRKELGLFAVEGGKEIGYALESGYRPHSLLTRADRYDQDLANQFSEVAKTKLSESLFSKLVYREDEPSGLIAVFHAKDSTLNSLSLSDNPFLLVVEGVEKPGNLGAIIRTADGAGVDAIIVAGDTVDIYNPNVIRASVGCVFTKQVVAAQNQSIKTFLDKNNIQVFGAELTPKAKPYTGVDFTKPLALVLGPESSGLSDFWLQNSQPIIIPMKGRNSSLNLSAATAVLAYEVIRQRL